MTQPAARTVMQEISPKLAELSADVLFGDVWERPELSQARPQSDHRRNPHRALPHRPVARTHRASVGQRRHPFRNIRGHYPPGFLRRLARSRQRRPNRQRGIRRTRRLTPHIPAHT